MFGTIHVYYEKAGYGFISVDFKNRRFFHIDNYHGNVLPTPGMAVEFDLAVSKKPGKPDQAVRIIPVQTTTGGAK
jgi:cold shock CspA family protein